MKEVFEKIKERLEKLKEYEASGDCPKDGMCSENPCKCTSCYSRTAIEIVDQVAEEYGKDINAHSDGWIPCSERLPEKFKLVLCTEKDNDIITIAWYREFK